MNFASFDLNLLRVFDALMREQSATRAGERLGLSQPAVSAALNRLRYACADKLFVRRGSEMLPTPRAQALAATIRQALAELELAVAGQQRFDPVTARGTFTLLGADILSTLLVPSLFARLRSLAPNIVIRFLDSARGDVALLLRDDLIDIAIERPLDLPNWVVRKVLYRSPFVFIAARDNPAIVAAQVKAGEPLPIDLFCRLPHAIRSIDGSMTGLVDAALAVEGRSRQVVLAIPHFYGLAAAVAQSDLIAAMPVEFARWVADGMDLVLYAPPLEIPAPEISLYWHKRRDRDAAHLWLRDQIGAEMQLLAGRALPLG
jgi:DNA-binding transcriptional LysR family regulator